jgi:transglutaminase-like putative cysteine protease
MNRRALLSSSAAFALFSATGLRPAPVRAELEHSALAPIWRRFEITTKVVLRDAPGAAQLWLPLAQTASGYQTGLDLRWEMPLNASVVRDRRYGAELLKITWDGAEDVPKTAEITQLVATRERSGADPVLSVTEAERQFWLQPTQSMPTDGIVRDTASRITAGITDPKVKLRAIYDWVVENTSRNPETPGCGFGDIKLMLETGNLSGKCADINGLMTGLARAAGFPARDVYGIRVAGSQLFKSIGASGNISKAQHCRSEVFLEDTGWFPIDPADVRKVILEQKLDLKNPEVSRLRERLFGSWEMNWVGYNSATDIVLPDVPAQHRPNFAFMMYPCAFTTNGQPNCLDPASFQYEITARELTA